jgi:hypothetical protein
MCTVRKHLLLVVGQEVYPPSLWMKWSTGEGSPGETKDSTGVVAHS